MDDKWTVWMNRSVLKLLDWQWVLPTDLARLWEPGGATVQKLLSTDLRKVESEKKKPTLYHSKFVEACKRLEAQQLVLARASDDPRHKSVKEYKLNLSGFVRQLVTSQLNHFGLESIKITNEDISSIKEKFNNTAIYVFLNSNYSRTRDFKKLVDRDIFSVINLYLIMMWPTSKEGWKRSASLNQNLMATWAKGLGKDEINDLANAGKEAFEISQYYKIFMSSFWQKSSKKSVMHKLMKSGLNI